MSSNIEVQRICQHCGKEFTARTTATRYCSHKCSSTAYKARKRNEKVEQANATTKRASEMPALCYHHYPLKEKEFLTVKEVAVLLGCSKRTVYRFIEDKKLKAVNLSERMTRVRRTEIDEIMTKREVETFQAITPEYYDISECYHMGEIQAKFGISEKALYELIKRYDIMKIKQGRHSYVPKAAIDKLLS